MSWNYRFMKHVLNSPGFEDEIDYELHEVYYDDAESERTGFEVIRGWTKNPVTLAAEDMKGAVWIAERIMEAAHKPALDYDLAPEYQPRIRWETNED